MLGTEISISFKRSVASDYILHCLLMSHKKDARLKWVKIGVSLDIGISIISERFCFISVVTFILKIE